VRLVDEPIADRVGGGLLADDGVPEIGFDLACNDRRGDAVAIFEDVERPYAPSSRRRDLYHQARARQHRLRDGVALSRHHSVGPKRTLSLRTRKSVSGHT